MGITTIPSVVISKEIEHKRTELSTEGMDNLVTPVKSTFQQLYDTTSVDDTLINPGQISMKAVHRLICLDLWGNSVREEQGW